MHHGLEPQCLVDIFFVCTLVDTYVYQIKIAGMCQSNNFFHKFRIVIHRLNSERLLLADS